MKYGFALTTVRDCGSTLIHKSRRPTTAEVKTQRLPFSL